MRRNSPLFGAAVLLVDAGAISSLFAVFLLVETGELVFPALPVWCGCLLCCYGLLCFLLRRPRTVRTLVITGGGFCLLQLVLAMILYGRFAGTMGMVFALCAWAASYYHACSLALKPPTAEIITTAFEVCVLTLLFSLFYCSVRRIDFVCALPAAVAAVAALAGLIARRTASGGTQRASRGAGTVLGVLSAFAVGALLLAGAAAGAVKTLALGFWSVLKAAGAFLGRCVSVLLGWLAALLPEAEPGEVIMEPQTAVIPQGVEEMEQLVDPTALLYGLVGLLALGVLGVLVWLVIRGGGKLRRGSTAGGGRVQRQRQGLLGALRRWLTRMREQLRFHVQRILRRNTSPGLFVWLERRSALRRKGRKSAESCREYLLRLAPDYPGAERELLRLAEDLDAHYFGSGSRLSRREIRIMRKALSTRPSRPSP